MRRLAAQVATRPATSATGAGHRLFPFRYISRYDAHWEER
jgi:hypothetical protein